MAGRPKKVTTENTTVESNTENQINKIIENNNSEELDILKKENAELKSQLQKVLEKLSAIEEPVTIESNDVENASENYKEINPLKPIKVVSLSDGGVSLRTNASGSGKAFRFDKFGHSISITYSDLQDIIATDRSFIEDGSVYICDADVVTVNNLSSGLMS